MCLLWANCRSGDRVQDDRACPEQAVVTRCAATQNAAEVDHSAAAGRSAEADRSAVVVLDAAADHFVALVGIRVVLNGARSVAPNVALNAVRRFSWGDFRSEAQVVIPETT